MFSPQEIDPVHRKIFPLLSQSDRQNWCPCHLADRSNGKMLISGSDVGFLSPMGRVGLIHLTTLKHAKPWKENEACLTTYLKLKRYNNHREVTYVYICSGQTAEAMQMIAALWNSVCNIVHSRRIKREPMYVQQCVEKIYLE